MNTKIKTILPRAIIALALSITVPATMTPVLASDAPAWENALRLQLLKEKRCNLNYLTNVKEQKLGNIHSIQARAHCVNGEAFDIQSIGGTTHFDIRECGTTIC